ncbi:hypothetical protein [Methylobacterium oryzae]|uniref:Uncharacterized protein n=1 Tax=Methylobacterium oryzae TaxID=334852 RepID=A0ABU7TY13_9HYPH
MKMRLVILATAAGLLAPAAASAQYYEGGYGYRRPHDHVDVYRHGDHDDDVVRHHHPRRDEGRFDFGEHRQRHHHDDD